MPSEGSSYLDHVVASAEARLDGMRVVVDCANGAASAFAPAALERLGAEVIAINAEPDGSNINVDCGALYPEVVAEAVVAHAAPMRGSRTTATPTARCSPTPPAT